MRVSVIIASWNAGPVLGRCLESLALQEVAGGVEIIVVDNASTDDTAQVLARHGDRVRVMLNETNAGFSEGNNQAAEVARGDVLFFLNSDTELLSPDALERVVQAVEEEGVGVAGPMLVNPDGTPQPSCAAHPSVARALLVGSGLHRLVPNAHRPRLVPEHWSHDRPIDTGWVMGAALAIPASLFRELDGFWPTMYAEDEDLAFRVQRRGLRVRFEPSARVMHVGNFSSAQRWSQLDRAARVASAELVFLRAHYPRVRAVAIRALSLCAYAGRAAVHRLLGRRGRAQVFGTMARVYVSGRPVG